MSKEEIALELTKLSYPHALKAAGMKQTTVVVEEVVTDLYNYILKNMDCSE